MQLLQHRQVAVGLDITHRAGIAVPVPGATEIAAFFDHPDIRETRFAQPPAHQQATEAPTDDRDLHRVGQRRALDALLVRVIDVVRKIARGFDVLLVAIAAQAPVALGEIFCFEDRRVEIDFAERDLNDVMHGVGHRA